MHLFFFLKKFIEKRREISPDISEAEIKARQSRSVIALTNQ